MKACSFSAKVFAVVVLLWVTAAQGATVEKMTLPQLSQSAQAIVIGTITDVSYFQASDRNQIYTRVTMDVRESLKGSQSGTISFTQLGGVIGDRRVSVSGFPVFVVDQELLLFLNDDPSGTISTVGLGQGKFNVLVDQATGEKKVVNDVVGLEMVSDGLLVTSETISMSLADMKKAVHESLNLREQRK
ncbi:MAG TPA: hypothetical protein VN285_07300 [Candidatus Deferrimicrobium sp.]|nr:hypothetical protein [Candidatus Deferrimicrobium sp.]